MATYNDGTVYALDPATGATKWKNPACGYVEYTSIAVGGANGYVYVGSHEGCVVALSGTSGTTMWTASAGDFATSPAVGDDGTVFVGSSDGFVLALDPGTGATKWTFTPKVNSLLLEAESEVGERLDGLNGGWVGSLPCASCAVCHA